jgi:hypothetical protein
MKNIIWVIAVFLFINTGCSSSKITSSWKAANTLPVKYNKIMVLGLIRDADRTIREMMENHLADDLNAMGYHSVTAIKEYGPKAFDNMEEEAAVSKLKNSGVEAVLTIVLLDKEKERRYVPGHVYYSPYVYYQNRFWGYYGTLNRRIYETGYYVMDTKYFWESNFYDMSTQKLIYSVQTQSFDPSDSESLAHEYGKKIINDMMKQKILAH